MTQIFLLGTFHFMQSNIDFYTQDTQQQLWNINEQLKMFNPDAIAVEVAAHAQAAVDSSYQRFSLDDLSNYEKMRNETLGTISMFGNTYPIPYNTESVQISYRLGKTLGVEKVYAIDNDTLLEEINEETPERIKSAFEKHWEKMHDIHHDIKHKTILESLKYCNSDEWSYHNQQLYLVKNEIGASGSYEGANFFGQWYMRNLKIFANLQKLSQNHESVFVLYGCGHLYILRELINLCENMELVDYRDYINIRE
ncbi:MAG: DUF5694 domain-containing protein [Lachnospiraceae bacterium]|nr:DUF5694 domain-containing protein [Lachnospiraceae bacterium]